MGPKSAVGRIVAGSPEVWLASTVKSIAREPCPIADVCKKSKHLESFLNPRAAHIFSIKMT